jgi:hypothetical protein
VGNKAEIHAALPARGFRAHRVKVVHPTRSYHGRQAGRRRRKGTVISRAIRLVDERKPMRWSPRATRAASSPRRLFQEWGGFRGWTERDRDRDTHARARFILLDSGANIQCKTINLAHYAVMGGIFTRGSGCKTARRRLEHRHRTDQRQRMALAASSFAGSSTSILSATSRPRSVPQPR